jgi:D-tyrosyl-tRNA(Tyr) deacylase
VAAPLVDAMRDYLTAAGVRVATGRFGADMQVSLTNNGPYTLILDSEK